MKLSNEFLTAKKDKNVRSLIVAKTDKYGQDRTYMYLCIDAPIPYTDKKELVFVETDTDIRIENYSAHSWFNDNGGKVKINKICFHCDCYRNGDIEQGNYVANFLRSIKKDSDLSFKVVAYNSCDTYNELKVVAHQLYGYIDNKEYFLSSFVGYNNTASPIQ